ncbi:MAG: hypothetical protein Q9212_002069 [Teloschistes hypoglaucus]
MRFCGEEGDEGRKKTPEFLCGMGRGRLVKSRSLHRIPCIKRTRSENTAIPDLPISLIRRSQVLLNHIHLDIRLDPVHLPQQQGQIPPLLPPSSVATILIVLCAFHAERPRSVQDRSLSVSSDGDERICGIWLPARILNMMVESSSVDVFGAAASGAGGTVVGKADRGGGCNPDSWSAVPEAGPRGTRASASSAEVGFVGAASGTSVC